MRSTPGKSGPSYVKSQRPVGSVVHSPDALTVILSADEGDAAVRNLILVATEGAAPTKPFLVERWNQVRQEFGEAPDLTQQIRDRYDREIPINGVPTLTDQYAPTDALLLIE